MPSDAKRLELDWRYLLIGLLPILVFAATDGFLHEFGDVVDQVPPYFAPFDAHREAAARLAAIGMFVLLVGLAAAACAYFAGTVLLLTRRSQLRLLLAFVVLMLLGLAILKVMNTRQMQDYLGPSFICTALGYTPEISRRGADAATANSTQPKVRIDNLRDSDGCSNARFKQLRTLLDVQKIATMLVVAALALGAICCLAAPPGASPTAEEKLAHFQAQSNRLNIYLYLSAAVLVAGLLFVAAYAHWPSYALTVSTHYDAHANAFAAYLGFSYTLLIGSFYGPVAALLSAKVAALKPAAGNESGLPEAFKGPMQVLKIVSAIFSTALAGILPAILGLGA